MSFLTNSERIDITVNYLYASFLRVNKESTLVNNRTLTHVSSQIPGSGQHSGLGRSL